MSFDALPDTAWPNIAAGLAHPWHPDACAHDLRWHAARRALRGVPLPGIRELADRWGWPGGKNRVQRLIDSGVWLDELRPWGWGGTVAGHCRDTAGTPTVQETPIIEDERDSRGTVAGQSRDSRADPISAPLHPSPFTPDMHASPPTPEATPPTDASDTLLVWKAYRQHHPGGRETLSAAAKKYIPGALRELSAESLILIIEWAHLSPDSGAHYLRGDAWEAGTGSGDYLGIDNLLRYEKLDARDEKARAWDAAGRPNFRDRRTAPARGGARAAPSMFDQLAAMMANATQTPDADLEVIDA